MTRKLIAIIAEIIPVISAILFFILISSSSNSVLAKNMILVTMLFSLMGFAFFLIGRKLAKESKAVRILGILDLLATVSIIGVYILAAFAFGL